MEGKLHQVKGKIKEVAGKIADNPELEIEGKGENAAGKVQEKAGISRRSLGSNHWHLSKGFDGIGKEAAMLWTIFVILLVLWALGLLTGYTIGGVIHALLVIAIIVMLIQVFQGRRRL